MIMITIKKKKIKVTIILGTIMIMMIKMTMMMIATHITGAGIITQGLAQMTMITIIAGEEAMVGEVKKEEEKKEAKKEEEKEDTFKVNMTGTP